MPSEVKFAVFCNSSNEGLCQRSIFHVIMLNLIFTSDSIKISIISYHQYPLCHVLSNILGIKHNDHTFIYLQDMTYVSAFLYFYSWSLLQSFVERYM